ncbi:unnamed protein product [Protopolystoma xenopodis]|uniref:Uncharacterized protein n=1 Tax=Protopolystoma xenopodis TaxID=117903 RepID=A0A448XQP5_9PLAT|nr:unnamed protein product [Protopolystoma xenopodis]
MYRVHVGAAREQQRMTHAARKAPVDEVRVGRSVGRSASRSAGRPAVTWARSAFSVLAEPGQNADWKMWTGQMWRRSVALLSLQWDTLKSAPACGDG